MIDLIVYDPLWKTLKNRGITTYKLIEKYGFSSHTVHRLKHNGGISTNLIDMLCKILKCKVEDILEYIPNENFNEFKKDNT